VLAQKEPFVSQIILLTHNNLSIPVAVVKIDFKKFELITSRALYPDLPAFARI